MSGVGCPDPDGELGPRRYMHGTFVLFSALSASGQGGWYCALRFWGAEEGARAPAAGLGPSPSDIDKRAGARRALGKVGGLGLYLTPAAARGAQRRPRGPTSRWRLSILSTLIRPWPGTCLHPSRTQGAKRRRLALRRASQAPVPHRLAAAGWPGCSWLAGWLATGCLFQNRGAAN